MMTILDVNCFGSPLAEAKIIIPESYNHQLQIDNSFTASSLGEVLSRENENLTSSNFPKTTHRLEKSVLYRVEIIPIRRLVTCDECFAFYQEREALFVGAQGLTLVASILPDILPFQKCVVSFDKEDFLWEDALGFRKLPFFYQGYARLCSLGIDLDGDFCLLLFYNE